MAKCELYQHKKSVWARKTNFWNTKGVGDLTVRAGNILLGIMVQVTFMCSIIF